jgi:hypothetical protein
VKKLATTIERLAYTPAEAAASIGVGPDYFETHIAPELRWIRRGAKRIVSISELDRWLADNAEVPMVEQVAG